MKFTKFAILALFFACGCSVVREKKPVSKEQPTKSGKSTFFASVPITKCSYSQTPYLNIEIEGKTFSVQLDLGFQGDMAMAKESMDVISTKTFVREKPMYGIRGKEYIKKLYRIPKAKIGSMTFSPPIVQEEDPEFLKDARFLKNKEDSWPEKEGRLGWELFCNAHLLIDVRNARIAFCSSPDTLKKGGYAIETFIKAPLLLEQGLVEFEAETPTGPLRCMLDTGCTWNLLNAEIEEGKSIDDVIWEKENLLDYEFFKIGEKGFGPITFRRVPIKFPIHIEAILGMEFFKKHVVFLDFPGKCVYFSHEKASLL